MTLRKFIEKNLCVTDGKIIELAEKCFREEHLKKGARLIEAGEYHQFISFLREGIARGFLIDADGRETTDCFAFRSGDALVGCNTYDEPSQINIEAVTDCEVYQISVDDVTRMLAKYPELLQVYNRLLVNGLKRHWEIKMSICRYPAAQRYQWFQENYPGLVDVVSNKDIASFLGITPVTLSRLKRHLREQGH